MTVEQREVMNACTRKQRQSITPEERQALLSKRRMSYAARRDTPCAESIAVRCPEARASPAENPSSYTSALTIGTEGDLQSFLNNFMDEDAILGEIMDEEYYIFTGEGGETLNLPKSLRITPFKCRTTYPRTR